MPTILFPKWKRYLLLLWSPVRKANDRLQQKNKNQEGRLELQTHAIQVLKVRHKQRREQGHHRPFL
jgi:hypothetical protein